MRLAATMLCAIACCMPVAAIGASASNDFPMSIQLSWHKGDRGTTIALNYEMKDAQRGVLKAEERSGDYLLTRGYARLSANDVAGVLASEQEAKLWRLPETMPEDAGFQKDGRGVISIAICYSGMKLSISQGSKHKTIARDCQRDEGSMAAAAFARQLIRIAQNHFPDLARMDLWQDELKQSDSIH